MTRRYILDEAPRPLLIRNDKRICAEYCLENCLYCGPPAMMDATKKMLAELGMPNTHIKTEAFGAAKPEARSR